MKWLERNSMGRECVPAESGPIAPLTMLSGGDDGGQLG